jgi:hypothetical protein
VRVTATHQLLGDGGPLSFQTPLASIHGVLGGADMFASTPDGGLRATALGGHWIMGDAGAARNLTLQVVRHWFKPADAGLALGEEWNVSLTTQIEGFRLGAEFASYEAGTFAGDTRKAWFTIARTF